MVKSNKKPRNSSDSEIKVTGPMRFEVHETFGVIARDENGEIIHPPDGMSKTIYYERPGKVPKVVMKTWALGGVSTPIGRVYDRYIAIDTSYKELGGNYLCTTAFTYAEAKIDVPTNSVNELKIIGFKPYAFLTQKKIKPERLGWAVFINSMATIEEFQNDQSFCIIVDSDLDQLEEINNRMLPVFEDFFLPDNCILMYASADNDAKIFPNMLINQTDRNASHSLVLALEKYKNLNNINLENDFLMLDFIDCEPQWTVS